MIILLFFMSVAITVTSASIMSIIINSTSTNIFQLGTNSLSVAESGAENALLRILRNPDFSGENLTVAGGTVNVTVTGSSTKTIISQAYVGNTSRKIEVVADYNNNILSITSWKEIL